MNERNTADIIDAIVAEHRRATRRVRARLAAADEQARSLSAPEPRSRERPGAILRSAKEPRAGDEVAPDAVQDASPTRQRPVRWLS